MKAFHVNLTWMKNASAWNWCNDQTNVQYDKDGSDHATDQVPLYNNILANNINLLVYSGNDDLVCAYQGSRYWIDNNLSVPLRGENLTVWQSWFVNGDVGGWYQAWEKFVFLVVRDAGHEVPEYQPARAYAMFRRFLTNNWTDVVETVPDENFVEYGTDDTSTFADSHFWAGFGIAIAVMVVINMIVCVVYYYRCRYVSSGHEPLIDSNDS